MTLGDYLHAWLDGLDTTGRRETTIEGYRKKILRYVLPNEITKLPLQAVTAADLDKLYSVLVTRGGRGGGRLSLRTVRHVHTIVGKALSDAERQDMLPRNPARQAQPPSAATRRARRKRRRGRPSSSHDSSRQPPATIDAGYSVSQQ